MRRRPGVIWAAGAEKMRLVTDPRSGIAVPVRKQIFDKPVAALDADPANAYAFDALLVLPLVNIGEKLVFHGSLGTRGIEHVSAVVARVKRLATGICALRRNHGKHKESGEKNGG